MPDIDPAPTPTPAPPKTDPAVAAAADRIERHVRVYLRANPGATMVSLADASTPSIPTPVLLELEHRLRTKSDTRGPFPNAKIDTEDDGRVVTLTLEPKAAS